MQSALEEMATEKGLVGFPVEATKFALYLQHIGETSRSKAAVEEAVNTVLWLQCLAGQDRLVSHHHLIINIVERFQRLLAKPKVKKEPITPAILQDIMSSLGEEALLTDL